MEADIEHRPNVWARAVLLGAAAFSCFFSAAVCWPGGGYNPFMRMLSSLGRTVVNGVELPVCHYLFIAGMGFAALGVAAVFWPLRRRFSGWRRRAVAGGAIAMVAGFAVIAFAPENVNQAMHNAGCWLAAGGGAALLLSFDRRGWDRVWTCVLLATCCVFLAFFALHAAGLLPFAPWFPSTQKLLIVLFVLWIGYAARRNGTPMKAWHMAAAALMLSLVAFFAATQMRNPFTGCGGVRNAAEPSGGEGSIPLTDDERAAMRWLAYVTGELEPSAEKDWWNIGGSQHGLFGKRYSIAFCGYAAAALGMRGGEAERAEAGRIIGRCISRYLKRDVWAYSMSRNYWGDKPWAPDPCYSENVMYTGHLLQLLALYEMFTGDTRYWTVGFDFVWRDGRKVHYTVKRLIDVTVRQMRRGPNGGVCCEPGLMFFPCNNHPHIALALFARLGHGDWSADARRWERWAVSHYARPLFGGGALDLVYHVKSGIFYPRGHGGLDGWSLLWYEPWASDRRTALALWSEAVKKIDWHALEIAPDARKGGFSCCDPADVPPVTSVTFLAAAARACDDPATADRLERLVEGRLVRRDGMLYLDVGRDWRIGSTANYIISRAESNGFRFRAHLHRK